MDIGTIRQNDTFGESSVLFDKPMSYTVIACSAVELATIEPSRLAGRSWWMFI